MGTPDYMSPEQLKGEQGTAGSDIYAVGVMLYEMLCGHTPISTMLL
jgi:serine/threonine protein kinase